MSDHTVPIQSSPLSSAWPDRVSPGVVGACAWAFTVGAIAVSAAMGGTIPSPYSSTTSVARYFIEHGDAALASAIITFASAPLVMVFGVLLADLLRGAAPSRPSVRLVATAGMGAGAVVATAAGGLWMLTRPEGTVDPAVTHLLADAVFVLGGPVFALLVGMMCLGVAGALAARPGPVPRPIVLAGLVIAAVSVLAALGLLWSALLPLMPIVRFGGLGWLTVTAVALTRATAQSAG